MNRRIFMAAALTFACMAASGQELSLEDCRSMACGGNSGVLNAELDILSAKEQKNEALSLWFPSVSVTGLAYRTVDPLIDIKLSDITGDSDAARFVNRVADYAGSVFGFKTEWTAIDRGYTAAAIATQPLFAGGRIVNGNRLAGLGVRAAEAQRSLVLRETLDGVDEKYWLVVSLQDKAETLEDALAMLDALGEDVMEAYRAGLALDSDTLRVNKERNRLLLDKVRLESGLRLAKTDLLNYIGLTDCELSEVVLTDSLSAVQPPEAYFMDSAELASGTQEAKLLDMQVEAAELRRRIAVGEALPQVAVGASYGYGKIYGDPTWNGVAFASVSIPVTDWWSASRKAARIRNDRLKAENDRDYLNRQLLLKADMLRDGMVTSWSAVQIARENVELDALSAARVQDLYELGGATLSEVLRAQVDLRGSRSELVDAMIAYRKAVAEYLALAQ